MRRGHPETDRRRDERGSISLYVVVIVFALFAAIGLVVDGGGKIRALQRAESVAAEAARVAGQAVDGGVAMEGLGGRIDAVTARNAAREYLDAAGVEGSVVVVDPTTLRVETTTRYEAVFLSLLGFGEMTTTGEAEVHLVSGVGERR
jgi:Flp pilus assembly protein TadG